MKNIRMRVHYTGRVQGVGFRYTCKQLAKGFVATGCVRNLEDGRVELIAEGEREELEAYLESIAESHLQAFIRDRRVEWLAATGEWSGFSIER